MSSVVDTLIEMGFPKERAELAVTKTKTNDVQIAMDWLLSNEDVPVDLLQTTPEKGPKTEDNVSEPNNDVLNSASSSQEQAKSIRCDDCQKLFKNQTEVEFHAAKTGHENFSESTEEKKPLTEEEKKEQLEKIETKLKQRRLEREEREKVEALEKEKMRIRSGKEMLEAKKKQDDLEIRKLVEFRKREKEEEKQARQRVKDQIEQDKLARKAKFASAENVEVKVPVVLAPVVLKPAQNYNDVKLQIRLTNGNALTQTFGAKEPLSAVRVYIEMNRTDEPAPFSLMTNFPKKVFDEDDFEKPLDVLGLAPSANLIVKKI